MAVDYKQLLKEYKIQNIKRGDIYEINIPDFVGSEQGGKRYCLVIQNNVGNIHSPTVIVAFITSKIQKKRLPTHYEICLERPSIVLCEQIRTIDKRRLGRYVATLTDEQMRAINECLKVSLDL